MNETSVEKPTEKGQTPSVGCGDLFGVWVPANQRLPEHGCKVLACYVGVYDARVVTFWRDGGGQSHFGYPESNPVTHWMPIPETPNVSGEPRP